jgi:hypothetical protein
MSLSRLRRLPGMSKSCPCHYCERRTPVCHDIWPEYKIWCHEEKEWKAFIKKQKYIDSLCTIHEEERKNEI